MRAHLLLTPLLLSGVNAKANLFYDFVEDGTGQVLATWELTSLPASYEEVVGLTFTPAGEAMFGLGSVYPGDFDHLAVNYASDDGMGGIGDDQDNLFGAWIFDGDDVPASSHVIDPIGHSMSLLYRNDPGGDELWYNYNGSANGPGSIRAWGDWRLSTVPEPSTLLLAAPAVVGFRRPRRRQAAASAGLSDS